jgi:hypothetical protein
MLAVRNNPSLVGVSNEKTQISRRTQKEQIEAECKRFGGEVPGADAKKRAIRLSATPADLRSDERRAQRLKRAQREPPRARRRRASRRNRAMGNGRCIDTLIWSLRPIWLPCRAVVG